MVAVGRKRRLAMLLRKSSLICCVLLAGANVFAAGPRIDITAQLIGYDLVQATGAPSENTELPRITVRAGSEGIIEVSRDFKYGQHGFRRLAHLGIRMPVYVQMGEDGKLRFLLRAELCERQDPADPTSAVLKMTTSFDGQALPGKPRIIQVTTPNGKQATLQITFTPR